MMKPRKPQVICLLGATCTGKTDLALKLAECFPIEIVSVDSALVYRGMDVGTAKPSRAIRDRIPHHLIDIREPQEPYSAGAFYQDATSVVDEILKRGHIPFLVGGTMLYFKAFLQGLSPLPSANPDIRLAIQKRAKEKGWDFLYERLKVLDSAAALRIHPHDKQRLQRALEVYELTQQPLSAFFKQKTGDLSNYSILTMGLFTSDRVRLHQRIQMRFEAMLNNGFIEEVVALRKNPQLTADAPAMRSVGYRQIWLYLDGQYDKSTMQEKALAATRQLAKRQMTWLRHWQGLSLFESEDPQLFDQVAMRLRLCS